MGLETEGKKSFGRITKDIISKSANLQITEANVLSSILLNMQLFECKVTNFTGAWSQEKITNEHSIDFQVSDVQTHPCLKNERSYILWASHNLMAYLVVVADTIATTWRPEMGHEQLYLIYKYTCINWYFGLLTGWQQLIHTYSYGCHICFVVTVRDTTHGILPICIGLKIYYTKHRYF